MKKIKSLKYLILILLLGVISCKKSENENFKPTNKETLNVVDNRIDILKSHLSKMTNISVNDISYISETSSFYYKGVFQIKEHDLQVTYEQAKK